MRLPLITKLKNSYRYVYRRFRKTGNHEILNNYFRKHGINIGKDCRIYSNIISLEPYLISIGDNVTISTDVRFITHDNSIEKIFPEYTDIFGRIIIGNNCFIGANVLLLPGVSIGNNTIVAAGSIVSKSFGENVIIGGNPAKIIGTIDDYKKRVQKYGIDTKELSPVERKNLLLTTKRLIKK